MTYPKIDKPTVPGWYWARFKMGSELDDFEIVRLTKSNSIRCSGADVDFFVTEFTSYRGPLPEPTE